MTKNYKLPTIEDLIASRVHIGHQIKRWHPNMFDYIYTSKQGVHIFDLEKTLEKLDIAAQTLFEIASKGKKVIFVGTKRQAKDIVALEAARCGAMYVTERWLGGTVTNLPMIRKSIKKLIDYKDSREKGEFTKYTKRERLLIDREIIKLEKYFGGLVSLTSIPDALVLIDAKKEKTALKEAKAIGIPVIALIDTNTDPKNVDYPIPGNDDAMRSIAAVLKVLGDALEAGYKEFAKKVTEVKTQEIKLEEVKEATDQTPSVTTTQAPHITKDPALEVEKTKELLSA